MKTTLFATLTMLLFLLACQQVKEQTGLGTLNPMSLRIVSADDFERNGTQNARELISADDIQAIIIQDADSAIAVVIGEDTLALCDAVYHDPDIPWEVGKEVIVVKDHFAQSFIIIQDRDGARRLQARPSLVKDVQAHVVQVSDSVIGVRNMQFTTGSPVDFDSDDGRLDEPE